MQMLMGSPIARIFAETEQRVHTDFEDMLLATLRFANGVIGTLRVNWLSPRKVRTLSVLGENGQFLLDYGSQDLWYFAPSQNLWAPAWPVAGAGLPDVTARKYPVEKREPLRVELEAFVAAVREGLPPPVPAEAGIRALAIADLLVESGRTGRALTVPEAL
jgi:predicted dehydrogenase